MEILKANISNLEEIVPLFDLYRQFYQRASDPEIARKFLSERLLQNESVIFYSKVEDQAVGFVQLYPTFSSLWLQRLWILNDLFVIPAARRKSVGKQLVLNAMDFAQETKARGLTLKTAIDNEAAQRFYESLGWKRNEKFCTYDKPREKSVPESESGLSLSGSTEGVDFYYENGLMVFTRIYHLKRGYCCKSGCRFCPY